MRFVVAVSLSLVTGAGCGGSSDTGGAGGAGGDASSSRASTGASTGSATSSHAGTGSGGHQATSTGATTSAGGGGAGGGGAGGAPFDRDHVPSTLGGASVKGSTGCDTAAAAPGEQTVTLTVGGAARTALVVIPAGYDADKAYPVVFVFHGDGGTGASARSGLNLEGDAAGAAIFVYPDGAGGTWDHTLSDTNADMQLVLALRDDLRGRACVDLGRTFLTGVSRGGFFVNQLACQYGFAEFTAIAPHSSTIEQDMGGAYVYGPPNPSGGPYTENGNYDFFCPVDRTPSGHATPPVPPPAAMIIHGECDAEQGVTYNEGRFVAEHWGYAARCSSTPAVAATTSPNPTCDATKFTASPVLSVDPCTPAPGCAPGHEITFCAIPSMDHRVWSEAHARIWSFFAAH